MKVFLIVFLALCISTVQVQSLLLGGLLALKGLALGLALGSGHRNSYNRGYNRGYSHGNRGYYRKSYYRRYHKRSVQDLDQEIAQAEIEDTDDCAQMFICSVNTKTAEKLDQTEQIIRNMFGNENLDLSKTSVRFDLAALVGKEVGIEQCQKLYGRCQMKYEDMRGVLEMPETNFINQY